MEMHNLNINDYSWEEILALFGCSPHLTETDMLTAKRRLANAHPDKSTLPPEYFIFYKQAYSQLLLRHKDLQKQNVVVADADTNYQSSDWDDSTLFNHMQEYTKKKDFRQDFNRLYEEGTQFKERQQESSERSKWFSADEPAWSELSVPKTTAQLNQTIRQARQKQMENQLVVRRQGVQEIQNRCSGSLLFEDDEDHDQYIDSGDVFAQLKYDDVRKVHKDQTIFVVDESEPYETYRDVDHYTQHRNQMNVQYVQPDQSIELQKQQAWQAKQFRMTQKTDQWDKKNKEIMGQFMRLK